MSERYEVQLADEALYAYATIPVPSWLEDVDGKLELLCLYPRFMGAPYDPVYEAAIPPEPCLVTYAGYYGIYYTVDDEAAVVQVVAIVDQRRDPTTRFSRGVPVSKGAKGEQGFGMSSLESA